MSEVPLSTRVALVDEAVELWSKMLQADHLVQQNVLHEATPLPPERPRPVARPTLVPAFRKFVLGTSFMYRELWWSKMLQADHLVQQNVIHDVNPQIDWNLISAQPPPNKMPKDEGFDNLGSQPHVERESFCIESQPIRVRLITELL